MVLASGVGELNDLFFCYLDAIISGVKEADAPDVGQDGVCGVILHVVGGYWWKAVSLRQVRKRQTEGQLAVCHCFQSF